jgi:regulator of protease activity HflC (stomatin/prohibitin superfamily)
MLGFRFLKVPPTTYVMWYRGGKVVREGGGLSFFYFAPMATIVQVPVGSTDVPFVFSEISSDFQDATIQGQLTYRISEPKKTAGLLDFSLTSNGQYQSDDPTKLGDRLCNSAQVLARAYTQRQPLHDLLIGSAGLRDETLAGLRASDAVQSLGVEILDLVILSIKPTPEMSKAFEAGAREELLQKADLAISARRNAAVEQERTIKENELNTEIAVEQKKGQVRDTKLSADIAIEQRRTALVDSQVANQHKEAEARAFALRAILEPIKGVDWRVLLAANAAIDPKFLIALGFQELAQNASKIGELNVSPDLLNSLLRPGEK